MNQKKLSLKIYRAIASVLGGFGIEKKFPIRIINLFVLKRLKSNFANVQGHKMFLDSKDSLKLSIKGVYEEFETDFIKNEIKRDDIVLDIGANIGYYTLIFAKLVGENGKVFAFEPDPTNFAILKKNVKINGYKNVVLINKAVSDKAGKLKLFLSEDNMGDHRTYDSKDDREFVEIESVKLDDYFDKTSDKINFIKMDIQGAEYAAVKGMSGLVNNTKDLTIVTEFWPIGLKRFGVEPREYYKLLIKYGFKIYELNENKKKLKTVNITRLLKKYTINKGNQTNFLCKKT